MWFAWKRTSTSFAAVFAAYLVYWLLAVPWIEPPSPPRARAEVALELPDPVLEDAPWKKVFPPGSWELERPKTLETEQALLLIRQYRLLEGNRLELKPCTLIWHGGKGSGDQPGQASRWVVLQAEGGAVLQFRGKLDPTRGQIGPLDSGMLAGRVTIHSGELRAGAEDLLELETRDIQITRDRVSTPHEVVFRQGKSHGSGRELVLTLGRPLEKRAKAKEDDLATRFGEFQSLELARIHGVHLELERPRKVKAAARSDHAGPWLLDVTCRGPFRHDFAERVASFEDDVQIVMPKATGPADRLSCQRLNACFAASGDVAEDAGEAPAGKSASSAGPWSSLSVENIEATGNPVVLEAPSYAASARAARLDYNFRTRRVTVEDEQSCLLQMETYRITTRRIEYQLAEGGRIGQLRAAGAGRVTGVLPGDERQPFEAAWQGRAVLQPHQGDHALSLLSDAAIRFPGIGEFTAGDLHIWFRETKLAAGGQRESRYRYDPVRLLALDRVHVDASQMLADTERAEVWVRYEEPPAAAPVAAAEDPSRQLPGERQPTSKYILAGRHIQLQLVNRGAAPVVEHLIVDGDVRFREAPLAESPAVPLAAALAEPLVRTSGGSAGDIAAGSTALIPVASHAGVPPASAGGAERLSAESMPGDGLSLLGSVVQVEHADAPHTRVRIQGRPATIAARGVAITGLNVQLDRIDNHLWIAGPGDMVFSSDALAAAARSAQQGTALAGGAPSGPLRVAWQGRMDFDGRVARFHGDVRLQATEFSPQGERFEVTALGQELAVWLQRPVDFNRPRQDPDQGMAKAAFVGPVAITNRGWLGDQPISYDRMQVLDLAFEQPAGQLTARGPGWGTTIRREGERRSLGLPDAAAASAPGTGGLSFARIDFEDQLLGQLAARQLEFQGRVRAIHGPVAAWDEELDPDPIGGLGEDEVLLSSDRLLLADMRGPSQGEAPALEMVAAGNASIEGQKFSAHGWRISYAHSKQLAVLEGDGRSDAEVWLRGSTSPDAAAQQIRFWTSDLSLQVDGGRHLNLGQLGTANR